MLNIVVAAGLNGAIGKDNKLLWHLPDDLKYFKKVTMGHPVIMGRATYDSIGRPLPGRKNIVVSRNKDLQIEGCEVVPTPEVALKLVKDSEEIMLIGGADMYRQLLPQTRRVYMTLVNDAPEADRFFPTLLRDEWKLVSEEFHPEDEKHKHSFKFQIWERIG